MTSNPYHRRYLLLAFTGLLFSTVLLYHHIEITGGFQTGPSACSINDTFDCDAVARSQYSVLFGIPVASWAMIFYFGLLLFLAGRDSDAGTESGKTGRPPINEANLMLTLAIAAAVPTTFLFVASVFIINKVCLYCTVLYITNLLLLAAAFFDPSRSRPAGAAVANGVGSLLGFGVVIFDSSLLVICFLAFAGAVFAAPERIIKPFLSRYQISNTDLVTRKLIFDTWNASPIQQIPVNTAGDPVNRDWSEGPENAGVTIVEFFDYSCPHCKNFGLAAEQLLKRYPNDLRLIVKNFPLDPSCNRYTPKAKHLISCKMALTARCLAIKDPALFWSFNRKIFSTPEVDELGLQQILGALNVPRAEVDSCTARADVQAKLGDDMDTAYKLHINHTPSIYINGKMIDSPEISRIEAIIDQLISRQKNAAKSESIR